MRGRGGTERVGVIEQVHGLSHVRAGPADQLSLSPIGTSTGGTLYVSGRGGAQFAVRVAGVTGRTRVLRFDPGPRTWRPY